MKCHIKSEYTSYINYENKMYSVEDCKKIYAILNKRQELITKMESLIDKQKSESQTTISYIEKFCEIFSIEFYESEIINLARVVLGSTLTTTTSIKTEIPVSWAETEGRGKDLSCEIKRYKLLSNIIHDRELDIDKNHIYTVAEMKELVDSKKIVIESIGDVYEEIKTREEYDNLKGALNVLEDNYFNFGYFIGEHLEESPKEKLEKYPELVGPISELFRENDLDIYMELAKKDFAKELTKISSSLKRASKNHKRVIKESLRKNTACEELKIDVEKARKLLTPVNSRKKKQIID